MNPEILTLGEPLIEFSASKEGDLCNGNLFVQGFGGDTSNFAISAARSGSKVGYISSVGKDPFGNAFIKLWENEGIDVSAVYQSDQYKTGIYFISRNNSKHEFTYFRKDTAASRMTPDILPVDAIREAKILHLSGITQGISSRACDTNSRALSIARESGTLISYDPNLRTDLWSLERAKAMIHATVPKIDILFPSYEDACLLTGLTEPDEITDFYLNMEAKSIVLKLGEKVLILAHEAMIQKVEVFNVESIDTSGAGDTFCGAFAAEYVKENSLGKCMQFAGASAALSTRGIGCVAPIPNRQEVLSFMNAQNR